MHLWQGSFFHSKAHKLEAKKVPINGKFSFCVHILLPILQFPRPACLIFFHVTVMRKRLWHDFLSFIYIYFFQEPIQLSHIYFPENELILRTMEIRLIHKLITRKTKKFCLDIKNFCRRKFLSIFRHQIEINKKIIKKTFYLICLTWCLYTYHRNRFLFFPLFFKYPNGAFYCIHYSFIWVNDRGTCTIWILVIWYLYYKMLQFVFILFNLGLIYLKKKISSFLFLKFAKTP